jgi:protein-tyrosine kinase
MGKISDALERHKKERFITVKRLPVEVSEDSIKRRPESTFVREWVSQNSFSPKVVVLSAPDSLDAENFKILRAQILFPKDGKRPKTIMVTSSFPGEGKTFVAVNLAVSLALGINEHVLLLDCDLRRPELHNMLGCSSTEGLHEYLMGKRQLPDLLIRTKIEKLSFLAAGTPSSKASELLSSIAMKEFLKEVKERYDDRFIIIDAPPSQVTAEANVLANYVDGVLFVIMAQRSPREAVKRNIENFGNKVLGIVLNGYAPGHRSYHKYDKYYNKSK